MAITRWDPFGEMLKMQRDMDRIFSRMGTAEGRPETATTAWMPRINVLRSGDDLTMHVELAGIKPEDVDIEVTDGVLTVRGERKAETEKEDEGWVIRESSYGSFERSVALPEGVDPASIKADFHDGMLEIHVPKALEAAKPKATKIAIGDAPQEVTIEAKDAVMPPIPQAEQPVQQPEMVTHH
jgi:HSP20 family protein